METLIHILAGVALGLIGGAIWAILFMRGRAGPDLTNVEAEKEYDKIRKEMQDRINADAQTEQERIKEEIANESTEGVIRRFFNSLGKRDSS